MNELRPSKRDSSDFRGQFELCGLLTVVCLDCRLLPYEMRD